MKAVARRNPDDELCQFYHYQYLIENLVSGELSLNSWSGVYRTLLQAQLRQNLFMRGLVIKSKGQPMSFDTVQMVWGYNPDLGQGTWEWINHEHPFQLGYLTGLFHTREWVRHYYDWNE